MNELDIQKELQKFNVSDAGIAELKSKYSSLTIADANDKEGYKAVRAARLDMKSRRVDVDKKRKELTEDAVRFQKAINVEAQRIISLIHPIEDELFGKEEWFEEENERIKREAAEAEEAKIRARVQSLIDLEMKFDSVAFTCEYLTTPFMMRDVKSMPDDEFNALRDKIVSDYKIFVDARALREKEAAELKAKQEAEARELRAQQEAELKRQQEELAAQRKKAEAEAAAQDAIMKHKQEEIEAASKAIAEREAVLKAEAELLARQREEQAKSVPVPAPAGTCRANVDAVVETVKESELTQDVYVRPDKKFLVEISGTFKVLYQVEGKDEEAAKDNALNDLHHMKNPMGIDFEQSDLQVFGEDE